MISTVVKDADLGADDVLAILDEASQVIEYSRRLEQESRALEVATDELRRANRRLTELDRLKDDFLSMISHELRTPLTSIRSSSEILRDDDGMSRAERRRFLDVVVQELERLTRLINELLDLSRIEAGRMDWRLSACDLGGVVGDAMAATGPLFEERQIRLQAAIEQGLPTITADRDRLIQVMINLLSNAAKFAQPEIGAVTVRVTGGRDQLCVSVEDNGPGVPEADRETVFEKFRQVARAGRQAERHRPGPRHLPADRRAVRRPDLGRAGQAERRGVPLLAAGRGAGRRGLTGC